MRRRLDWTPPPESLPTPRVADTPAAKELPSSASPARVNVFKNLQDTYGRPSETAILTEEDGSTGATTDVLGKRKLIEMVTTAGNRPETPEVSPSKPKAVKKKPRTITELATAAYRQPDEHTVMSDKPKQDTLLGYLDVTDGETAAAAKSEAKTAKMGRRPAKPKPKPAKTREEKRRPLLLSPASAMRQVARQDFVFGTASQLAAEDDPELLRALHEAMMVSNQADSDPYADSSPVKGRLALRRKPGSGLWAAGARGEDGDLIDLEVLDLTGSSPLPRDYSLPQAPSPSHKAAAQGPSTKEACIEIGSSDTSLDLSASPPFLHTQSFSPSVAPAGTRISTASEGDKSSDSGQKHPPSAPREADFEPPPSNQEQHQLLLSQPKSLGQKELEPQPKPNFELYTDARLAKEVASYGFKPVKKRTAMIALLVQCWSSQHTRGLASRTAQAPSEVADTPAPTIGGKKKSSLVTKGEAEAPQAAKRPRGRPKKDAAAAPADQSEAKAPASPKRSKSPPKPAAPAPATPKRRKAPAKEVVEIADSESDSDSDDPFASSPITSPDKQDDVFSPPAVDLSVTEDTETSLVASPTDQQVSLFRYITQAVVTAPRAKDPANPSWHEKMLMYDPIILEDLTAWLNSGQLDRVGYDGEVAPGDVKKWCESKSVCCLWRVSLNGKERKRF
ncbi:d2d69da2-4bf0-4b95-9817-74978b0537df [Thermothielavioides terrestris]|uniref:Structure-specific endonuclease subunit SLX4 n=1 Tax=Thermothielavioides terrestris TaxID=2587410 RepID=A0A3S4CYR8_9PEZI|nr:d2d69da2-4bf0-4b95-9817-74978b0537df [Thermothielavioides terrestris]